MLSSMILLKMMQAFYGNSQHHTTLCGEYQKECANKYLQARCFERWRALRVKLLLLDRRLDILLLFWLTCNLQAMWQRGRNMLRRLLLSRQQQPSHGTMKLCTVESMHNNCRGYEECRNIPSFSTFSSSSISARSFLKRALLSICHMTRKLASQTLQSLSPTNPSAMCDNHLSQ